MSAFSAKKIVSFLAKLSLTLGAFAYILHEIDEQQLAVILKQQDISWAIASCMLVLLQLLLAALRWRHILYQLAGKQHVINRMAAFNDYYISIFFMNCLPGGLMGSDVVRVWLAKARGVSTSLCINSVVIDRVIALLALGIVVLVSLPRLGVLMGFEPWPLVVVSCVLGALGIAFLCRSEQLLARFAGKKYTGWILALVAGFRSILFSPKLCVVTVGYSVLAHVIYSASVWVLAHSMGMELSLLDAMVLVPLVLFLMTLPISIGGWGVRELGLAGTLALVGIPTEAAVLLGVQIGILAIVTCLPAGVIWLFTRHKKAHAPHDQPV